MSVDNLQNIVTCCDGLAYVLFTLQLMAFRIPIFKYVVLFKTCAYMQIKNGASR